MPAPENARLAEVRALVAALDDVERLRDLPLVRIIVGGDPGDDSRRTLSAVRGRFDGAIEALDARARAIIVRCDMAGETHRAVAAELGIGERHFYRERRRALLQLAGRMAAPPSLSERAASDANPPDALLGEATAFRKAGYLSEASALLAHAYAREQLPARRARISVWLADLASDCGRYAEAGTWIERGRLDVDRHAGAPGACAITSCELDLAQIRTDIARDAFGRAEMQAHVLSRRLRALAGHAERDRITAAIGTAYTFLSEVQIMLGSFSDALASALEGRAVLQRGGVEAAPDVDAAVAVAQARVFAPGSLTRAFDDFALAYSRALAIGSPRDIAKVAASLALVSALRGDAAGSAAFSRAALAIGTRIIGKHERVVIAVDLAAAAIARGDLAVARSIVAGTRPRAHGLHANILALQEAEIELRSGQPELALTLVRSATGAIGSLQNSRFLGSAYRVEAEVYAALGRRPAANSRIADALECLGSAAHPIARSRALALSARLTGNRRHAASAREIDSSLAAG